MKILEVALKPGKSIVKYSGKGELNEEGNHNEHADSTNTTILPSKEFMNAYNRFSELIPILIGFTKLEENVREAVDPAVQRAYAVLEEDIRSVQDGICSKYAVEKLQFRTKSGNEEVRVIGKLLMRNGQQTQVNTDWIVYTADSALGIEGIVEEYCFELKVQAVNYVSICNQDKQGMFNEEIVAEEA